METGLLEKDGPITVEDLKVQFQANDFSSQSSGFGDQTESKLRNERFLVIRNHFKAAWRRQLKELTGKPMRNFSATSPIGCLENSEADLVAGTLVDLMEDEQRTDFLLDQGLQILQEPLEAELEQLAKEQGKTADDLTEEEFAAALDRLSEQFISKMMRLLLQAQEAEMWVEFSKHSPAHEDFNDQIKHNFDRIDFIRQWDHLRTKIGTTLSLTDMIAVENEDMETAIAGHNPIDDDKKYEQLIAAFCASLDDDIDAQIVYLCDQGLTHAEIAQRLGFKTHSAITKRIQKIYKKCCDFLQKLDA